MTTHRDATLADTSALTLRDTGVEVAFRMDEDAFRGFYDRTSRMLWAYLRRLTDRHAADDLLQETYYRFLCADVEFESEAHRRHYLFRIATNLARDRARRESTRPRLVPHDDELAAASGPGPSGALDSRLAVNTALAKLGPRERALLWLAYAQGASHQEIAAVVGVRTGSVKALLYRARRRLATMLGRREARP